MLYPTVSLCAVQDFVTDFAMMLRHAGLCSQHMTTLTMNSCTVLMPVCDTDSLEGLDIL